MTFDFAICIVGFGMLFWGAEWLVKGSSSLAGNLGVSPVVIGLTVVAFGTSAPELVVSIVAAVEDKSMLAIGNVVGSNILNIALVLGLASVFQPITTQKSVIRRDIPIMLGVSALLFLLSLDSRLDRVDGIILFTGVILYTVLNYFFFVRGEKPLSEATQEDRSVNREVRGKHVNARIIDIVWVLTGIAGVVFGAQIVVDSATRIMSGLGVSEKFIGLTIIALGTSLPELATSVVAALKKEMDISIGNLIGSNVFNILSVLGATATIKPVQIPGGFVHSGLVVDYLIMIIVSCLPWFMMRKSYTISRPNGFILLACYLGFVVYLWVFRNLG
jgi:cation:H+ antiporter